MTDRKQTYILFAVVVAVSAVAGFANWMLFAAVAFGGGYAFASKALGKYPAALSASATSLGWLIVALVRDVIESGRLSTKLSGFLSLPFGVFMYIALFALCFIPSFFAAWSGALALSALQASKRAD